MPKKKKHRKPPRPQASAIVPASPPTPPAAITRTGEADIRSVAQTVQDLNRVRRFIVQCLNVELTRALAELKADTSLKADARKEAEKALRKRLEIDWGTIPGVEKPFLMQPGAEKVLFWLHLRPEYHTAVSELGNGHMEVVSFVRFYAKRSGTLVFEGPPCSCTTMEDNYRFRYRERLAGKPPQWNSEEDIRLREDGLGKWRFKEEWKKVNGVRRKVGEKWVWMDRIENPNIHNERNKVRQIGEKRSLVKGVRNLGALSEIFVSDPGEWLVSEDGEEFGTPDTAIDYTPSGRAMTIGGRRPSDIERDPDVPETGSTEAAQAVAKRKIEENEARKASPARPAAPSVATAAGAGSPPVKETSTPAPAAKKKLAGLVTFDVVKGEEGKCSVNVAMKDGSERNFLHRVIEGECHGEWIAPLNCYFIPAWAVGKVKGTAEELPVDTWVKQGVPLGAKKPAGGAT
jgi:hypothetical protein